VAPPPAVAAVRSAVRAALRDAAAPAVLVACSGGADSVALAAALAFEAPRCGRVITAGAVTVDHGVQAGSAERAAAVVRLAEQLGLAPVEAVRVDVGSDGGPEAAARAARYEALAAAAERLDAVVLLGHTLDDQAETVLLGLARGSGARSLAGMPAAGGPGGRFRRPLLGLRRATTRAACAALELPVWDDPHNADPAYARARVRADVLPAIEQALGPGVAEALVRTAAQLRDDGAALDAWTTAEFARLTSGADGLAVVELAALPTAIRRRVLRLAALAAGASPGALAAVHLAAADALVVDWHGQGAVALPGAVEVVRRYGRLYVAASGGAGTAT
jgi:tRNA(Ile)-lysidine synthase